jgi:hypothetical protein
MKIITRYLFRKAAALKSIEISRSSEVLWGKYAKFVQYFR